MLFRRCLGRRIISYSSRKCNGFSKYPVFLSCHSQYCTDGEESQLEEGEDQTTDEEQTKLSAKKGVKTPISKNITPAMHQYKKMKESVPGYILLFQLGDFFEIFYEDAILVSKLLDLTLTARGKTEKASE